MDTEQQTATLVQRKKRGTKLQFMVGLGGTTVEEAASYLKWEYIPLNIVVEFRGERTFCSLIRTADYNPNLR